MLLEASNAKARGNEDVDAFLSPIFMSVSHSEMICNKVSDFHMHSLAIFLRAGYNILTNLGPQSGRKNYGGEKS